MLSFLLNHFSIARVINVSCRLIPTFEIGNKIKITWSTVLDANTSLWIFNCIKECGIQPLGQGDNVSSCKLFVKSATR